MSESETSQNTVKLLLADLRRQKVDIRLDGEQVRVSAPKGVLTPALMDLLRARKSELRQLLRSEQIINGPVSPIPVLPRTGDFPLSFAQERLWLLDRLQPNLPTYNVPNVHRLHGALDADALGRALHAILERHEPLRTVFRIQDGMPRQAIQSDATFNLRVTDLASIPATERETRALRLASEEANRPFDLAADLMLRATLLRLAETDHLLVVTIHHIASDGWSSSVFWHELTTLYGAFLHGQPSPLQPLPIQYADYSVWQRQWLQSDQAHRQLDYWQRHLAGAPALLDLPTDRPRPPQQSFCGAVEPLLIPRKLLDSLKALGRKERATLFMVLLTGLNILLYRYTGEDDLVVAAATAGRNRLETEGLIGLFLNSLALRTRPTANISVGELLAQVRENTLNAYANQDLPFEAILDTLPTDRSLSHTPLFQVMLILQNTPHSPFLLQGIQAERLSLAHQSAKLDLTLSLTEQQAGLSGTMEYNTDLFDAATIARMLGHYQTILESMVADPKGHIATLPLLTAADRRQLSREWNRPGIDLSCQLGLIPRFHRQVARSPDATAYLCGDEEITFAELNRRANRLACFLQTQGLQPGVTVGVRIERSPEMAVAFWAIFKAGGVYVPLDPGYPAARLQFILEDAGTELVLTTTHALTPDTAVRRKQKVICLDRIADDLLRQPADDLPLEAHPNDPAYIIYTSGSTGEPKGVLVPHRQILNRLEWMWSTYPFGPGEMGCQKTALNFVDSLWELTGYLLQGVPTVILPDEAVRDPYSLVDMLAAHGVTRLWLVPSLLRSLLDTHPDLQQRLPRLRFWVSSGEPLPLRLLERFQAELPRAKLYNLYGTSEVWDATWFDPSAAPGPWVGPAVPIGRPISNVSAYILDRRGQLNPVGVPGELCVGGAGLALGYVKRAELTAERFISAHWTPPPTEPQDATAPTTSPPGERLYHTGDLARWLPDGNLVFLGRTDYQVKLRGHRIELQEIEAQLERHPAVRQAVVVTRSRQDGEQELIAYVVPRKGADPASPDLVRVLRQCLPEVMVPARFVVLTDLPLTPSGKVDRNALPAPDIAERPAAEASSAPRTPLEEKLATIWAELLELPRVGIHDSFFDLGGHSLLGVRLFHRMEGAFGVRLPLSLLFGARTIAELAPHLEQPCSMPEWRTLVRIQERGDRPPFFCVHGFGGGVLGYADLARLLGADQPFYGFQAAGFDGREPPDDSVEAMATRSIAAMRNVQPSGPYRIGGYCFGGVVAFEMARQLEQQDEMVALVAIMEGYAPGILQQGAPLMDLRRVAIIWRNIPFWLEDYWRLGARGIGSRVRQKLRQRSRSSSIPEVDDVLPEDNSFLPDHQRRLMEIHLRAVYDYKPKPYPGKVTLFSAQGKTISRALSGSLDPQYGWGALALGGVDVQVVEGGHRNIHLPPYVASLAASLDGCLRKAGHLSSPERGPLP